MDKKLILSLLEAFESQAKSYRNDCALVGSFTYHNETSDTCRKAYTIKYYSQHIELHIDLYYRYEDQDRSFWLSAKSPEEVLDLIDQVDHQQGLISRMIDLKVKG